MRHVWVFTVFISFLLWTHTEAQVRASGTFQSKSGGAQAAGGFQIIEENGALSLHLPEEFKVSTAPDLYFVFNPVDLSASSNANAKTNALRIEPKLRKFSGADTYALPADIELSKYKSLLIHCWQFNQLYAGAVLNLAPVTSIQSTPKIHTKAVFVGPLFDVRGKRISPIPSDRLPAPNDNPRAGYYFRRAPSAETPSP